MKTFVKSFLYRPFDVRQMFYHETVVWRPRREVMRHMLAGENIALVTTRQTQDVWGVFAARNLCGHKTCAAYDINYVFPLYLYPDGAAAQVQLLETSPWPPGKAGRRPNIDPKVVATLEQDLAMKFASDGVGNLQQTFGPEDVLAYIYAVWHSPTYRARYSEFLAKEFPRVPFTRNPALFKTLVPLGRELLALHLLESAAEPITQYPIAGENHIEKGFPKYSDTRVYINPTQYLEGVAQAVWEFYVGGYQVCQRWLRDRQGRVLSYEDIVTYQKIIAAISETIRLMHRVDEAVPSWPLP